MIDEGKREALRIEFGTSIPSARLIRVMGQLVEVYGRPDAIRLDNGPDLTAHDFVEWAEDHRIQLRFIQPGKPFKPRTFNREVSTFNLST